MKRLIQSPIIVWTGGFVLFFIVFSLARKNPALNKYSSKGVYESKMDLALRYMQQGPMPMAGIKLLKKLTTKYPNRYEAPMQLGEFSMNTGQYSKASGWFEKAANAAKDRLKVYAGMKWSDALFMNGKIDSAKIVLTQIINLSKDSTIVRTAKERIKALNK